MKKNIQKTVVFIALLFVVCHAVAGEEMTIRLTANPPLPIQNILKDIVKDSDFSSKPLKWKMKDIQNGSMKVLNENGSDFMRFELKAGNALWMYRTLPISLFKKGESYILSCRVRPQTAMPVMTYKDGGPGFSINFYPQDYSKGKSLFARTANGREISGQWITVTGEPTEIPEWAEAVEIHVGFFYYNPQKNRTADISTLAAYPAFTTLNIAIQTKESSVKQVKVVNENEKELFFIDIPEGNSKSFTHSMRVKTTSRYTVMAILLDGTVETATYPSE